MHSLNVTKIQKIIEETSTLKTFYVENFWKDKICPGQFIMVWIPGIDEIPMGLSHISNDTIAFTVERVGEATEALHKLKQGDLIGVRGPYGNGFKLIDGKILIVGGGNGISPLKPLLEALLLRETEITVLIGSKSAYKMPFIPYLKNQSKRHKLKLNDQLEFALEHWISVIRSNVVDGTKKEN